MGKTERRMNAYYYGFGKTGDDRIDKILSAVACAGKAFHHTESWHDEGLEPYCDHTGESAVAWIQNAADEAAEARRTERKSALEDACKAVSSYGLRIYECGSVERVALHDAEREIRTLMERDDE